MVHNIIFSPSPNRHKQSDVINNSCLASFKLVNYPLQIKAANLTINRPNL